MGDEKEDNFEKVRDTLICSKCNSKNTYTNLSGVRVCRKCGHREEVD